MSRVPGDRPHPAGGDSEDQPGLLGAQSADAVQDQYGPLFSWQGGQQPAHFEALFDPVQLAPAVPVVVLPNRPERQSTVQPDSPEAGAPEILFQMKEDGDQPAPEGAPVRVEAVQMNVSAEDRFLNEVLDILGPRAKMEGDSFQPGDGRNPQEVPRVPVSLPGGDSGGIEPPAVRPDISPKRPISSRPAHPVPAILSRHLPSFPRDLYRSLF